MYKLPTTNGPSRCRGDPGREWMATIRGAMLSVRIGPRGQVAIVGALNFAQLETIIHLTREVAQVQPHLAALAWVLAHSLVFNALFTGSRSRAQPIEGEDDMATPPPPPPKPPASAEPAHTPPDAPRTTLLSQGIDNPQGEWMYSSKGVMLTITSMTDPKLFCVVTLNAAQLEELLAGIEKCRELLAAKPWLKKPE